MQTIKHRKPKDFQTEQIEMSESQGGPTTDTLAGDVVTVVLPSDGYYGAKFVPDKDGCAAVLDSFVRNSGKIGPLEKHKGVHRGDVVLEVNETSTMKLKHPDTMKLIEDRNTLKKVLKFVNSKEYYRRKKYGNTATNMAEVKNTFYSTVKQFRYSTGNSRKKFVEYEISCQYRVITEQVNKEIIYKWSVWRRYSEFLELHKQLLKALGWQMDGIVFPNANVFVFNKLSPTFVENRRLEFVEYWQRITAIDKVTEFQKHHCSEELKIFLEVNQNMKNSQVTAVEGLRTENDTPTTNRDSLIEDNKISPANGSSRGPLMSLNRNSRRMSGNVGGTASTEMTPTTSAKVEEQPPVSTQSSSGAPPPPPPPRPSAPESSPFKPEPLFEEEEFQEEPLDGNDNDGDGGRLSDVGLSPNAKRNNNSEVMIYTDSVRARTMSERENFLDLIRSRRGNEEQE